MIMDVPVQSLDQRIEITPGIAGGKPRIAGRRITVQNIAVWHEWMGRSVDDICSEHDLALADAHAALAYYYANHQEIDRSIRESNDFTAVLRERSPSKLTTQTA